ncbi:MAG: 50S ribosomal protein L10 [Candidatus Diapherotrites archaeon]|nr:50S ribosomal protein L10 [Candidatus Diapherotrites archaeon]
MTSRKMKTHQIKWKKREVELITPLLGKYSVIGIGDLSGTPASLLQKLRKKLHGKAVVRVSKTRIIKKALANVQGKEALGGLLKDSCVLVLTDLDPFEVFSLIKRNRTKAFAKAGYIAEDDIVVPAGDTGLPPGPALSDLKGAGLQIKIQGPTIAVTQDKVVAKKGEAVTPPVANVLSKLDIKPVKIGLRLVGVFENGAILDAKVLDIDADKAIDDFARAYTMALNLAFNAEIFNSYTTPLLIAKAFMDSKGLALETGMIAKETPEVPETPKVSLEKASGASESTEAAMPAGENA